MCLYKKYLKPRDRLEAQVISALKNSGLTSRSLMTYLQWIRRYREYCQGNGKDEVTEASLSGSIAFGRFYRGIRTKRFVRESTKKSIVHAIHAWACALRLLGISVPNWKDSPPRRPLPDLIQSYLDYRQQHRGVAPATLVRDCQVASEFLDHLRSRGNRLRSVQSIDLDSFVNHLCKRMSRRNAATNCSALRGFLQFLHLNGYIVRDLASLVCAPRYKTWETPPRTIPWEEVQQILRVIPRDTKNGRRDFAMLLLLAAYGLSGADVANLRLEDIDWRAKKLRFVRSKTSVLIELPLLPPVARAIAQYLKHDRPHMPHREVFLSIGMPKRPISSGMLRHQIRGYARKAGIHRETLGSHLFRHCHASRQVDWGTNYKVLSDILGHRKPESTSAYIRVAMKRLRTVALPVPT